MSNISINTPLEQKLRGINFYLITTEDAETRGYIATNAPHKEIKKLEKEWHNSYNLLEKKGKTPEDEVAHFVSFLNENGFYAQAIQIGDVYAPESITEMKSFISVSATNKALNMDM